MARPGDGDFKTVTVTQSWTVCRPDGTTAMVLNTQEAGPIAFRLDLKTIQAIRRELADCERFLSQGSGQA